MKRSSILVDDFCALERSSGYLTAEKRFEIKLQWASKWELSSPWNRHISDVAATVGQSSVGSQVPGAPGFVVAFQERVTPALYHDLSTDRNMGWVRPDSWLTYLTLNAPEPKVTYDLGVSSAGVIRLAPYGTPPMAVVDGQVSHDLPGWLPRLPLNTPQVLFTVVILLSIGGGLFLIVRRRGRARVGAQV